MIIPPQRYEEISSKAESVAQSASATASAVTIVALVINIALSGAMSQVWGMINGLQMFVYMPLFQIEFPEVSLNIVEGLITIVTFEVLPWVDPFLQATLNPPESEQRDLKFKGVGYETDYLITNLGTMWFTLVIILLCLPGFVFLTKRCARKSPKLAKTRTSIMNTLHGNVFIRYLLEGCLDISICA